jgi:hypothetical protein
MEDLLQDVRCEVLAWIQEQGEEVDTADLEKQVRNSAQRVVRHWLESRKRTVTLGEIRPDAIVYALSESGELPAWIPAELRDVAQAIIETSEESAAIGEPGSIPYAELCERLKISKGTLANRMKALRAVHIPDKRLSWYSAASEDYRADHPVTEPWYARTGSTPIRLGDIPAMQQRDNDNSDLIRELCPVADGLQKAIWEGLTACLFAVSAPHGQRLDARLLWGENWASCGRLNSL